MARKKIIFVIVEGPSDDEALGAIFSRAFNKIREKREYIPFDSYFLFVYSLMRLCRERLFRKRTKCLRI